MTSIHDKLAPAPKPEKPAAVEKPAEACMVFEGVRYVEVAQVEHGSCEGCAFNSSPITTCRDAWAAFGSNCVNRVIYIRADQPAAKPAEEDPELARLTTSIANNIRHSDEPGIATFTAPIPPAQPSEQVQGRTLVGWDRTSTDNLLHVWGI